MLVRAAVLSLTVLLAALIAVGCGGPSSSGAKAPNADTEGKLKVVSTIGMIDDLAGRIGGAHVSHTALMGPGIDPHLYKAKESDTRALDAADVIFYNGLHLEGKMEEIFSSMAARKKHIYAVTAKVDPKQLLQEEAGIADPHVWFDVLLWKQAAEAIRDGLVAADPAHAEDYRKNYDALAKEMSELHEWTKAEIASIPKEQRVIITAHDAFNYFGRAYEIEVEGIQGISTEDEAPLAEINRLVDKIVSRKIKAVFVESSVPEKNVKALIEGAQTRGQNVTIGGELFSDAMGEDGTPEGTYIGMIKHNVNTITKALK